MKNIIVLLTITLMLGIGFASAGQMGEQKALVILVNFADANVSANVSSANGNVFANSNSAANFYRTTTFNRTWFTGVVVGPVTINYTRLGVNCNAYHSWADSADSLVAGLGVNISQYNRVQYIIPNLGCLWTGMGAVSGVRSWVVSGSNIMTHAHEFGHNLGMGHASSIDNAGTIYEYGDGSDVMGNIGYYHVNAPHTILPGWNTNSLIVSADGTYTISHLNVDPSTTLPIAIRVLQNVSNLTYFNGTAYRVLAQTYNVYYYFSYRRAVGWDSSLWVYNDKLNIHKSNDPLTPTSSFQANTYVFDPIGLGSTFIGKTKFGEVRVTPLSYDSNQMTLMINLVNSSSGTNNTNSSCINVLSTMTISPLNQSGFAGSTLTYTGTLRNNDNAASCSADTYNLGLILPTGFNGSISPSSAVLNPGASITFTATVKSPGTAVNGNYLFNVTASGTQPIHATGTSAVYTAISDTTPPTAPTRLSGSSLKSKTGAKIKLSWRASTDNVGVTEYQVFRNNSYYASVGGTTLTYTDNAVTRGRTYTYYAVAKDAAGNTSPQSNIVSVTA